MYGYQALVDGLCAEGVQHVFAVPGDDNMGWVAELMQKTTIGVIRARRESGAAGMADGYSRATGQPGICTVTIGPGLGNTTNSLATAAKHRSPVICIVTEPPVFERKYVKDFDQRRFAETIKASYMSIRHIETLAADIQYAFRHVRSGQGTLVLAVPREVLGGELELGWDYEPSTAFPTTKQRRHPEPELVIEAVRMLRAAKKPAIIVGRGAGDPRTQGEIRLLAEHIGAILANTLVGSPILADHPYYVGISGGLATDLGHSLLSETDCVVAVGCSLNKYTTEEGLLFAEARIIHIDNNPLAIGDATPVALGIVADASAALDAINRELRQGGGAQMQGFWTDELKSRIAQSSRRLQADYVQREDSIDPRQLLTALDEVLPQNRHVVMDVGHFSTFINVDGRMSVPDPSRLVRTNDFASIGMGLYQGVGAAIGRPDSHIVVITGDGGFMMSLEELDTAVRYHIPMTIIIMNDGAFGADAHHLAAVGKPIDVALFDNPDFARIADAFGAHGLTVRKASDLQLVAAKTGRVDGPLLIDAKINLQAHEAWMQLVQALRPVGMGQS